MKQLKRICALLLSLAMVVGMLPVDMLSVTAKAAPGEVIMPSPYTWVKLYEAQVQEDYDYELDQPVYEDYTYWARYKEDLFLGSSIDVGIFRTDSTVSENDLDKDDTYKEECTGTYDWSYGPALFLYAVDKDDQSVGDPANGGFNDNSNAIRFNADEIPGFYDEENEKYVFEAGEKAYKLVIEYAPYAEDLVSAPVNINWKEPATLTDVDSSDRSILADSEDSVGLKLPEFELNKEAEGPYTVNIEVDKKSDEPGEDGWERISSYDYGTVPDYHNVDVDSEPAVYRFRYIVKKDIQDDYYDDYEIIQILDSAEYTVVPAEYRPVGFYEYAGTRYDRVYQYYTDNEGNIVINTNQYRQIAESYNNKRTLTDTYDAGTVVVAKADWEKGITIDPDSSADTAEYDVKYQWSEYDEEKNEYVDIEKDGDKETYATGKIINPGDHKYKLTMSATSKKAEDPKPVYKAVFTITVYADPSVEQVGEAIDPSLLGKTYESADGKEKNWALKIDPDKSDWTAADEYKDFGMTPSLDNRYYYYQDISSFESDDQLDKYDGESYIAYYFNSVKYMNSIIVGDKERGTLKLQLGDTEDDIKSMADGYTDISYQWYRYRDEDENLVTEDVYDEATGETKKVKKRYDYYSKATKISADDGGDKPSLSVEPDLDDFVRSKSKYVDKNGEIKERDELYSTNAYILEVTLRKGKETVKNPKGLQPDMYKLIFKADFSQVLPELQIVKGDSEPVPEKTAKKGESVEFSVPEYRVIFDGKAAPADKYSLVYTWTKKVAKTDKDGKVIEGEYEWEDIANTNGKTLKIDKVKDEDYTTYICKVSLEVNDSDYSATDYGFAKFPNGNYSGDSYYAFDLIEPESEKEINEVTVARTTARRVTAKVDDPLEFGVEVQGLPTGYSVNYLWKYRGKNDEWIDRKNNKPSLNITKLKEEDFSEEGYQNNYQCTVTIEVPEDEIDKFRFGGFGSALAYDAEKDEPKTNKDGKKLYAYSTTVDFSLVKEGEETAEKADNHIKVYSPHKNVVAVNEGDSVKLEVNAESAVKDEKLTYRWYKARHIGEKE